MARDAIGQPRQLAEHFAKDDAPVRAGLLDDAGRGKRRRDVGHAAEHRRLADRAASSPCAVDAVLQRQDRRVRPEHRRDERQRGGVVVRLDGDDDDIDRADARRVVFGPAGTVKSPSTGLRISSPRSRMAARCAPRAMNVTSCPARASFAP